MLRYAITIFLSAFLLFQIQPMIARIILPWFGGTAAVWTTCMMFFQIALLAGYAYAHMLRLFLKPKHAWMLHVVLLMVAVWFSNVIPPDSLQPNGDENLNVAILTLLAMTIGLPFFVLSTTGPLIQAWQSTSHQNRSPYRLYALSNLGSMLALVTYPFVIERFFPLATQAQYWSIGFILFAAMCFWSGLQTLKSNTWGGEVLDEGKSPSNGSGAVNVESPSVESLNDRPLGIKPFVWVLLSMAASVMLLATTNLMCQEVASVPFLWILPLCLYLLSFIICFDKPQWYKRKFFTPFLVVSAFVSVALVHLNVFASLALQVIGLAAVCFAASMTCHGELERLKPSVKQLTWFYLLLAVGGSMGGIFVAVVAPLLFTGFYEFHLALLVCLLVPLIILYLEARKPDGAVSKVGAWVLGGSIALAATFVLCSLVYFLDPSYHPDVIYKARNEYGLVAVEQHENYRVFVNGRIDHGGQYVGGENEFKHNAYYIPGSGVSVAFESMRSELKNKGDDRGLNIGILGLGAGGMMTWAQPKDEVVFYEINPEVEKISREFFTYLFREDIKTSVVLGDGRVQLQRRVREGQPKFDLLFMDAFASDSIPVHLITSECFEVYRNSLHENGILIAHISNRFVDLQPVVFQAAKDHGMTPILINFVSKDKRMKTRWVLMTSNPSIIESEFVKSIQSDWPADLKPVRWTDDYTSLASMLDWSGGIDWDRLKKFNEMRRQREEQREN